MDSANVEILINKIREKVEVTYLQGVSKGYAQTTVLVFDPSDYFARNWLDTADLLVTVDRLIREKSKDDISTYPAVPVPADYAHRLAKDAGRFDVAQRLREASESLEFGVVVFTGGRVEVHHLPIPN